MRFFVPKFRDYMVMALPPLAVIFWALFFLYRPPLHISDPSRFMLTTYCDGSAPGNSTISCDTIPGTLLHLNFQVGDTVNFAYVGGGLLVRDTGSFMNIDKYDKMTIEYDPRITSDFSVMLLYWVRNFSQFDSSGTHCYRLTDCRPAKSGDRLTITLDSMQTPTWWYVVNNISRDQLPSIDRHYCSGILFANHPLEQRGVPREISIRSITFYKNLMPMGVLLAAGVVTYLVTAFFILMLVHNRRPAVMGYQKLSVSSNGVMDWEILGQFLGERYHDSSITLEVAVRETGLSAVRIRAILREKFNATFRDYIATLRIAEAKRLLKETDRQIVEIAMVVGYPHVSTFNHLFKDAVGVSPGEYRSGK